MTPHPIVHIEFAAQDPAALARFYSGVFGWKTEAMPQMDYVTFEAEGGPGGGFPRVDGKEYKAGDVLAYIRTDDMDATLRRIEAAGGKTLHPKTPIPGIGWYAFFSDPDGNRVGLYAPGS
ncbi:MAG: VOC family protein [Chloroflexota bacterium]